MADFNSTDFDAIKVSLASADQIRSWSHGEVKKPETINYRTLKPEKDGLFCEKIFGPTKDWECACTPPKYKGIRFKGIVCERCGVEVTTSKVRRERMGHIELAAPVSHIWYFKSPDLSPLSRLLDIKNKELEKVLYFASYIVTRLDAEARDADASDLAEELAADLEELDAERDEQIQRLREEAAAAEEFGEVEPMTEEELNAEIVDITEEYEEEKVLRREAHEKFMTLEERELIASESLFREMKRYYSMYFSGGMGAEAVRELLENIDLEKESKELREIIASEKTHKQKREKAVKRLEIVDAFLEGNNNPANMILDVIPVLPPELRSMVQLDGGRFASSDLNDLYRRVINRNNRLKRLLDLDSPDVIINNEKRMLQEAVDALFDNGRRGRPVTGRGDRQLKSLAEALKGKQGRFRQNLLGKRVDYSGRSVIVVDPHLKLHQCGLPKAMALELFKPFVMQRLVKLGKVENIKGAKRAIDRGTSMVWDILDEVIKDRLVLLNRAPTLHRLSIQAFEPVLVEGKAIHLHPLVCKPFNADFDGDQMSVHLPLSLQAQTEARVLMLSSNNLRSPASGKVLTVPSQDMVFGVYYLTSDLEDATGQGRIFNSFDDALSAYDAHSGDLDLQAKVIVRLGAEVANAEEDGKKIFRVQEGPSEIKDYDVTKKPIRFETTVGRIIFNRQCLPADYPFVNYKMVSSDMSRLINDCTNRYKLSDVEPILDAIKFSGFHYATRAGLTISLWDAVIPEEKEKLIAQTQIDVDTINENYQMGFLSDAERHAEVIDAWSTCTDELARIMLEGFSEENPIYMLADSGARGSKTQLRQLAGMRGLMADMSGDTIDLPIKANFREGLRPLEYFISTYGARKGLVDTASHTSDSGYLTRRLVDAAQDVIVREADCDTHEGVTYDLVDAGSGELNLDLIGRCVLKDIKVPKPDKTAAKDIKAVKGAKDDKAAKDALKPGTVLLKKDDYIESAEDIQKLVDAGIRRVELRALLTCRSKYGVCQKCYGWDLSTKRPVNIGSTVGIIAAQSIGEPGTQLTMRTIHSGGVAGADDITQGLPTVGRMFDVVGNVNEKILGREADLASASGTLHIVPEQNNYELSIVDTKNPKKVLATKTVPASVRFMPGIEDGCEVRAGNQITRGFVNFRNLRRLTDIESTMHTFVKSVKDVYTSQGVDLNDKHIEVIARQMLRRVEITNPGDSRYLLGQYVDRYEFADEVERLTLAGKTPPEAEPTILGTLKVASSIDSWLSSASFIRTAGVLTQAAIKGEVDNLMDLKSNVISGKKIPAGTGLKAYEDVELTYHGEPVGPITSPQAKSIPDWAPDDIKNLEEQIPKDLHWSEADMPGYFSRNGRTLATDDAKLYLFDDLGVSQRWTNKFSEEGIETVGDLIGNTVEDLLKIDGIGAKAIEELQAGLAEHDLLFVLEPPEAEDEADEDDLSQLLNMVFSPDAEDVMLGTAAPLTQTPSGEELLGAKEPAASAKNKDEIINEDITSLDDLLTQAVQQEELHEEGE